MLHLSAERLAALTDAGPTPDECAHLAACDACAGERDAYVALAGLARAESSALALPLTRWERISAELGEGGMVVPAARAAPGGWGGARWPLQVAAGLLLCAGGAALGRMSAGATMFPERAERAATRGASAAGVSATVAALRGTTDSSWTSVEEARAAQARSEMTYERAAAYLAEHDSVAGAGSPVAYRSRLAALDQVISTTREALREAPHDPVINDYYLTTIGQREATLRQLNTALPASLRLNSF